MELTNLVNAERVRLVDPFLLEQHSSPPHVTYQCHHIIAHCLLMRISMNLAGSVVAWALSALAHGAAAAPVTGHACLHHDLSMHALACHFNDASVSFVSVRRSERAIPWTHSRGCMDVWGPILWGSDACISPSRDHDLLTPATHNLSSPSKRQYERMHGTTDSTTPVQALAQAELQGRQLCQLA